LVFHRDGVETATLGPGLSVVVGREAPADVAVRDSSLSRRHARFTCEEGEVIVEDLGSTNGTLVGGKRVPRSVVKAGDEVMMGAVAASIHVLSGGEEAPVGLVGDDAFRTVLEAELSRARFFGRSVAVLIVQAPRGTHLRHWAPRIR